MPSSLLQQCVLNGEGRTITRASPQPRPASTASDAAAATRRHAAFSASLRVQQTSNGIYSSKALGVLSARLHGGAAPRLSRQRRLTVCSLGSDSSRGDDVPDLMPAEQQRKATQVNSSADYQQSESVEASSLQLVVGVCITQR